MEHTALDIALETTVRTSDVPVLRRVVDHLLGLTGTETTLLPTLGLGLGLWRIRNRSFLVQAQLHPDEAPLFETGTRAAGISREFTNSERNGGSNSRQ